MNRTFDTTSPPLAGLSRYRLLAALAVVFFAFNLVVRFVLQIASPAALPVSASMGAGLLSGLVNDAATLVFVLLLPATLILLPRERFFRKRAGRIYCLAILFFFCSLFIFTGFAEYFFWDEFHARFNFIAVDYLIYTTEVIENMVESYPLPKLFAAVFLLALFCTALIWKLLGMVEKRALKRRAVDGENSLSTGGLRRRLAALGGLYAAAVLVFTVFSPVTLSVDRFWNEYARNGVYELFSAYRHNQLDYRAFYPTMDKETAFDLMRREMTAKDSTFAAREGDSLIRLVHAGTPEHKPNVILVLMESMGSSWQGEYTPNLNALAAQGLSFSDMMSTGTRTVRGIEAVMLSIPPTPGSSIVRRPDNDKLFTLGSLFRERGYELQFLYGGIGFFDNMNAFFAGNGYQTIDKLSFAPENKTFSTAWGQCDEDLFAETLSRADALFAAGKPFQQFLLTTSNHRPFTYPDGKIDMKPGKRKSAVRYTDYAIGHFMEEARKRPWFDNTIFIFVGDHPSSIAGKTEVPPDAYGIVCVMYGPKFFTPQRVDTLCSQIDVGPTLLAALGWDYRSQFFGEDARKIPVERGRAWISTYQLLGFRDNGQLAILRPDGKGEVSDIVRVGEDKEQTTTKPAKGGNELLAEAIASYQCAYDLFVGKALKEAVVLQGTPASPQRAAVQNGRVSTATERNGRVSTATDRKAAAGRLSGPSHRAETIALWLLAGEAGRGGEGHAR